MTGGVLQSHAGARALFAHNPVLTQQLFKFKVLAACQWVSRRAKHAQLIFHPGLADDHVIVALPLDQA